MATQPKATGTTATPIRSMTGYGRATVDKGTRVTAEVRAVNGRFLKLSVKVLGRYAAFEDRVKTLLAAEGIKRGSIDVSLFFESAADEGNAYTISAAAVKHYVTQARALARKHKLKGDVPLSALLPLPGVVVRQTPEEDIEGLWQHAKEALVAALADFNRMRCRDGSACAADIRAQLAALAEHHAAIRDAAPAAAQSAVRRFKERIARLLAEANVSTPLGPDALEREVVLMADRLDVAEELARLQSHFAQMEAALTAGGEVGKPLDFLTQELLRETNTIGSKAQDEKVTYRVVAMKGLIEKIREQVQNLE